MALCLNQLLDNKRSCPFILVNDSVQFSALPLLAEFAFSALRDDQPVVTILTETSPKNWIDRVAFTAKGHLKNMHVIDAYTDPFGWDKDTTESAPAGIGSFHTVRNLRQLGDALLAPIIQKTQHSAGCCIMIDSLHPLLLISRRQTYQLVKALESLTTDTVKLIAGYHGDIRLPSEAPPVIPTYDALNRLASVIITLESLPERKNDTQEALTGFAPKPTFSYMNTMSNRVDRGGLARIEWRKKSGKVQYATEGFYLGSKGLIIVAAPQLTGEEPEPEVDMDDTMTQPDPTANLSFNLSLTDNQRRAKDNVELPFMKVQQETTGTSGGHIYYQPDAGDDFDDEDPDDDLDI